MSADREVCRRWSWRNRGQARARIGRRRARDRDRGGRSTDREGLGVSAGEVVGVAGIAGGRGGRADVGVVRVGDCNGLTEPADAGDGRRAGLDRRPGERLGVCRAGDGRRGRCLRDGDGRRLGGHVVGDVAGLGGHDDAVTGAHDRHQAARGHGAHDASETAKVTGRPDEAVALNVKSASPYVLSSRVPKVMVCGWRWTLMPVDPGGSCGSGRCAGL